MLTEPVKCPEQNICKFDDSKGVLLMSTRQEQSHNRLIEVTCIIFLSMCVCAWVYMHEGVLEVQRVIGPLELELQVIMNHWHDVSAGTWTWVLCENRKCSQPPSLLSSPYIVHLLKFLLNSFLIPSPWKLVYSINRSNKCSFWGQTPADSREFYMWGSVYRERNSRFTFIPGFKKSWHGYRRKFCF